MRVYSLMGGRLMFVGDDGRRRFIDNYILTTGADGVDPEELARKYETLAANVRRIGLVPTPTPNEFEAKCAECGAVFGPTRCAEHHILLTSARAAQARIEALERALRRIVDDAKDEERADMRDSVDEQLIEEARAILDAAADGGGH